LAGHTIRWQGAGFVDVYPEPESKNPDNLLQSWRKEKINGALINCIEAVALCREYMYMLRKLQAQFLCHSLLLCNISAGSGD
ncbi:TPA: RepA leader peptide Tap, partial [Klebsiella pneumoniae]|jgi:RepA leader peptide Tap